MSRRRTPNFPARGEQVLSAVERIVDDVDDLIAQVETLKSTFPQGDDDAQLEAISGQLIADYSTRSAIAGGLTSLPALLPGGGTVVAIVGGALVDMTFMLKHDVEMILCLSYLHGFDIRDDKERWLAYVLAGIRTHNVQTRRNYLADLVDVQLDALPKYTPREMFKLASTVIGRLALLSLSRSFVRALPLIGIAVSASTNKFMTTSVGWWCVEALERRRAAEVDPALDPEAVDAVVR
jgi:uncharacterized protein (DUF697 family)